MTEEMYKDLFADCEKLLLSNLDPPSDGAYWDWLVSQSNYFGDKYGASDFVLALVLAVMDEIDRRYKAKNVAVIATGSCMIKDGMTSCSSRSQRRTG